MGLNINKRRKGFTLLEVLSTVIISSVLIVALSFLFIEMYRLRGEMEATSEFSREATLAMNHMTRVLRFAIMNTINITNNRISATIEADHINFIREDTPVSYTILNGDLIYTERNRPAMVIARHVTSFAGSWWDDTPPLNRQELNIRFTIADPARPRLPDVPIRTRIKVLGRAI